MQSLLDLHLGRETFPALFLYVVEVGILQPPRLTTQMLVGQMPVGGATHCGPEH